MNVLDKKYFAAGFGVVQSLDSFFATCGYVFEPRPLQIKDPLLAKTCDRLGIRFYSQSNPQNAFCASLMFTSQPVHMDYNVLIGALSLHSQVVNSFLLNLRMNTGVRLISPAAPSAVELFYMKSLERELGEAFSRQ